MKVVNVFPFSNSRVEPQCRVAGAGSSHCRRLSPFTGASILAMTRSLGPLVEPDIGFSPVRLSDDLLRELISNRCPSPARRQMGKRSAAARALVPPVPLIFRLSSAKIPPALSSCVFRGKPATHSDRRRPPIPRQAGHLYRGKAATDSDLKPATFSWSVGIGGRNGSE